VWRIEKPEHLKGGSRKKQNKREEKRRSYKGPIGEDLALKKKRREYKNKTVS